MALTCVYSGGWGDLGCSAGWPFQGHWSSPECHQFHNEIPAGFDNTSFHVPADFHSKSQITQCFFMYSLFIRNFTHEHQIKVCFFSKTYSSWSTFTIQKTFYIQANNSTFCYIYINTRNLKGLRVDFQEIVRTNLAMCFSNNKQMYSYTKSASFAVLYFRVTSYNINLELFENFKASKRVLGVMEK